MDRRTIEDRPLTAAQADRMAHLFREFNAWLVNIAVRRLEGKRDLAEDLVQSVWLKASTGAQVAVFTRAGLEDTEAFRLLCQQLKWAISKHGLTPSNAREVAAEDEQLVLSGPRTSLSPVEVAVVEERERSLSAQSLRLIDSLGLRPVEREVLVLHCEDGQSLEALASRLGYSKTKVARALNRAYDVLRAAHGIAPEEPEDPERAAFERSVQRLRAQGVAFEAIARRLSCSVAKVFDAHARIALREKAQAVKAGVAA
ncbi:RNA polymerase sigma factor [Streptomyces misionensis]|uniref:RNA polymerase sigma factor n=1 Tax=Streptomyces misionensis TaxID=67331 RepID=UPI003BAF1BD6